MEFMKNDLGMFFRLSRLGVGAAVLAVAGTLQASVLVSDSGAVSLVSDGSGGYTATVSVSQFDPSLGTLTGVDIQCILTINNIVVTLYNNTASSVSGKATFSILANSFTSTADLGGADASGADFTTLYSSGNLTVPKNGSQQWGPVTKTDEQDYSTSSDGYVGSGTINTTFDTGLAGGTSLIGDNYSSVFSVGNITFEEIVTYDYTSLVPEPSTWISGALLLGVVGLGAGRSLRRKGNQAVA
jgi:hypothetical protein